MTFFYFVTDFICGLAVYKCENDSLVLQYLLDEPAIGK